MPLNDRYDKGTQQHTLFNPGKAETLPVHQQQIALI